MHKLNSQGDRAGQFFVCNFQLFANNNKENSSYQTLRDGWVAKTFMSPHILY